jgi:hypothetical protein
MDNPFKHLEGHSVQYFAPLGVAMEDGNQEENRKKLEGYPM